MTFLKDMINVGLGFFLYTGWPKKVSHYQEPSLNRIKNRQCGYICHQF